MKDDENIPQLSIGITWFSTARIFHYYLIQLSSDASLSGECIFKFLKKQTMLRWTVIFLVVAIIAAILGFGGVAAGAASIAKILFFIFLVLFIVSLFFGRSRSNI